LTSQIAPADKSFADERRIGFPGERLVDIAMCFGREAVTKKEELEGNTKRIPPLPLFAIGLLGGVPQSVLKPMRDAAAFICKAEV